MAEVVGNSGIHNVRGFLCDLCGRDCDPEAEELNALDCTFGNCPKDSAVYHQDCLEKYLKSIRLEKNRKTGFRCPRGTGKGTKFPDQPCPGKIDKSHPIHIRNDNAKKRRKAQMPILLPDPRPKLDAKDKVKCKEEEAKKLKERKAKEDAAAKLKPSKVKSVSREEQVRQDKLRLQAVAQAMRRDMGLTSDSGSKTSSISKGGLTNREPRTLEEYESTRGIGRASAPLPSNAWAAPKPAGPHRSTTEPAASPRGSQAASSAWPSVSSGPPPPPPARRIPTADSHQHVAGPTLKLTKPEDKRKGPPVGLDSPSPAKEEVVKLSKAQKKNMRRSEKKAAERNAEKMSVASSEVVSDMDAISLGDNFSEIPVIEEEETIFNSLQDECAHALTLYKAQSLIRQLQTLGFEDWQCVPAIMTHGSKLEDAVTFLLEGGVASQQHALQLMSEEAELPQIDITPDLIRLQECKDELHLDLHELQDQVVQFGGDVEKACSAFFEEQAESQADSPLPADLPDPSPPQWGQNQDSGGLHSEFSNLRLDGQEWAERGLQQQDEYSIQHPSQHQEPQREQHWGEAPTGFPSPRLQPHPDILQQHFQPQTSRPVTSLQRYNELLGLQPPPAAPPSQVRHERYQPPPGMGRLRSQEDPIHHLFSQPQPEQRFWEHSGGPIPQQYMPQASQYAGRPVTETRHPAAAEEPSDLDIDSLVTKLIAH